MVGPRARCAGGGVLVGCSGPGRGEIAHDVLLKALSVCKLMFATLSRLRRQIAVLTALAMVASVLVAVPVAAADPPKADYTATFSACEGVDSAGFEDVPAMHDNAGDIDCIAYYGITRGTSATTFSPVMSVTREHMALFLTRLAAKVGIEVAADPDDAGFTDIGELSAESQTAINQLADLGITQGTSDTTYSPDNSVQRDHMALFISRLMDLMDPMTDGDDEDGDFGYTPSDVVDNDQEKKIGSPFTDLGPTTKSAYDAITNLWELGVASGISATSYAPLASITRGAMADFMAAVLDHSNARPAGVTIQATPAHSFGAVDDGSVVVSVRDDSFAPVPDQAVDTFSSDDGALDEDGACKTGNDAGGSALVVGDCTWNDNDEFTDGDGNIILIGATAEGKTNVYYAWIGDKDGAKFDSDDVTYVSASIASSNAEESMKVSTSLAKQTLNNQADLDKVKSVTLTVQLVDDVEVTGTDQGVGDPVKRAGVEITVGVTQQPDADNDDTADNTSFNNSAVATLTTDEDGKATYVVDAPEDDDDKNDQHPDGDTITTWANLENRIDTVTFTWKKGGAGLTGDSASVQVMIRWTEENSVTSSSTGTAPVYVVPDKDGDVKITGTMTLYDQFGRGFREASGHMIGINFGSGQEGTANVNRNGSATRRVVIGDNEDNPAVGTQITVTYVAEPDVGGSAQATSANVADITGAGNAQGTKQVQVVTRANDEDTGSRTVDRLLADDNEFLADDAGPGTPNSDLVYSYDDDDIFINGVGDTESTGERISLEKFEEMLGSKLTNFPDDNDTKAVVVVIAYKPGGVSIFQVTTAALPVA